MLSQLTHYVINVADFGTEKDLIQRNVIAFELNLKFKKTKQKKR